MEQMELFPDNPSYDAFLEKFKSKKTTDDCYTPENVYNAVSDWVSREYRLDRSLFVRPFWPDRDYQASQYPPDCIVVDNPPFSILAQIKRFYMEKGIRFFLFAPTLTLFSGYVQSVTFLPCGVGITYENGANVNTSFCTNLEPGIQVRSAPTLYKVVEAANNENLRALRKQIPKYSYPDEVLTAAMVARWCKYGIDFTLKEADCVKIARLDAQKPYKKTVFGYGFLLSEQAAGERAEAERAAGERAKVIEWQLSEREKKIVQSLGESTP